MQRLSEKWLRRINYYYVFVACILFGLYIFTAYQQKKLIINGETTFGANIAVGIFSALCLIYNLVLMRPIKKANIWLAYLISAVLVILANNAAVEGALQSSISIVYIINTVILVDSLVIFGPIIVLSAIAISGVIYAMTLSGTTPPTVFGVIGDGISILARTVIAVTLLFVFKNKYVQEGKGGSGSYIEKYLVDNEVVKLLTDSISDGVIITNQMGIIKAINPGAARLLQQNLSDLSDLDYRSVLRFKNDQHKDLAEQDNPIALALNARPSNSQELILVLKNKKELFVDIVASAIQNKTNNEVYGSVVILRDVSKKRQEEDARSEFISTASHEMRTPVAAIEGYLALALNENVAKIDDKAREFLQKAHLSTEHLGRLFQDLLVSAKAEDGRLVSHPDVIEMGAFLEQVTDDLKLITAKKGLGLEYITGSGENTSSGDKSHAIRPLYYAYADPDRMREIITNLFDNAVKYTEKGKITIGLTGNDDVVQFFVRDTGSGIPTEDVPHLFQKFYRVDNSTTRTKGGTGLGLFISRKILELYNGRIWVDSEPGKGSTFYVNLPRLDSAKASSLKKQPSSPTAQSIHDNEVTQV